MAAIQLSKTRKRKTREERSRSIRSSAFLSPIDFSFSDRAKRTMSGPKRWIDRFLGNKSIRDLEREGNARFKGQLRLLCNDRLTAHTRLSALFVHNSRLPVASRIKLAHAMFSYWFIQFKKKKKKKEKEKSGHFELRSAQNQGWFFFYVNVFSKTVGDTTIIIFLVLMNILRGNRGKIQKK